MMTIRDILGQGIEIEGTVKIQCYNSDTNTIDILYENEANDWDEEDEFLDIEIKCMFPYTFEMCGELISGICIELEVE